MKICWTSTARYLNWSDHLDHASNWKKKEKRYYSSHLLRERFPWLPLWHPLSFLWLPSYPGNTRGLRNTTTILIHIDLVEQSVTADISSKVNYHTVNYYFFFKGSKSGLYSTIVFAELYLRLCYTGKSFNDLNVLRQPFFFLFVPLRAADSFREAKSSNQ